MFPPLAGGKGDPLKIIESLFQSDWSSQKRYAPVPQKRFAFWQFFLVHFSQNLENTTLPWPKPFAWSASWCCFVWIIGDSMIASGACSMDSMGVKGLFWQKLVMKYWIHHPFSGSMLLPNVQSVSSCFWWFWISVHLEVFFLIYRQNVPILPKPDFLGIGGIPISIHHRFGFFQADSLGKHTMSKGKETRKMWRPFLPTSNLSWNPAFSWKNTQCYSSKKPPVASWHPH